MPTPAEIRARLEAVAEMTPDECRVQISFLLAENDRLRAVLEAIAQGVCSCGASTVHCDGSCFVARAMFALETPGAGTGK